MKYKKFSPKQLQALLWWQIENLKEYDGIICDGSVRSGKTMSMAVGFVLWSMSEFDNEIFAMCGKTIESFRRNVFSPLLEWLGGIAEIKERRSENCFEVSIGVKTNRYYIFGGRDESSASLIQGITLAGVLLDEVALMPRSFVEQALARCSVEGSKYWFNCNPEGPEHWFYKEWILKAEQKNILHLHFTMEDNYSLSERLRKRYESLYSGVFFDRYVRGLWCVAEGLVYPMFSVENITDDVPESGTYYISVDYGTLNPFSAGVWCVDGDKAVRIAEFYYDGRKTQRLMTDEEYYDELVKLADNHNIRYIVVDPSAASFIECVRRHGKFIVRNAKNDVLNGIRITANMLEKKQVLIHRSCKDSIREFRLYRWDEKSAIDKPIKENDHAMDDIRYMCNTVLQREFRWRI